MTEGTRLRTPSLRVRVIAVGMATWLLLVIVLDVFVFLSLRNQLFAALDDLLDARAQLALELGAVLSPEELDARLTELGVPALVRSADGTVLTADPAIPGFGPGPPGPIEELPAAVAHRAVELPDGVTVTVLATRSGVDRTLEQVLLIEAIGSGAVLVVMLLLLVRISTVLLGPVDRVVATAQRIAGGRTRERLRPDRPDTELGRLAVAFDEMLDALEDALEQAQAAEREARAAEAGSQRFLADAAHQLRTPVAALRASVDSLLRTEHLAERERLLDNLARESARVGRLVSSLLRVAELDRGRETAIRRVDLLDLVDRETERNRLLSPNIAFMVDRRLDSAFVDVDPDGIREVLANLMDNARRHAASRVDIEIGGADGRFFVRIGDDGPGLESGTEELAFDRFASFDGRGGSGLGLPIARAIARAHGGDVTYDDGRFVVRLAEAKAPREPFLPVR